MSKVIGFSFDEFKAKDTGDLIKGCTLYLGDERKDVTGLVAQRVFISEKKMGTYVPSIGKRIYKSIVLTESTSEAESRISENLKFAPFWNWTLTFIPKYAKYFDSFNIPDVPQLQYKELIAPEPVKQMKRFHLWKKDKPCDIIVQELDNDEFGKTLLAIFQKDTDPSG